MSLCEKIQLLCNKRGITIYRLEKDCNLGNGSVMKWGKSSPKVENVIKVADYFSVSTDYLLGREEKKSVIDRPTLANKEIFNGNFGNAIATVSSVPAVFGKMPDLLSEERFVNTAKIYHELPDEMRERAYGLICGIAIGLGLNINKIIGK